MAQGDAQGKADHRHGIVYALGPVSAGEVHAKEQHVAGLRVGKDVVTHQVGVAVHEAASQGEKDRQLDGLGFLLGMPHV